MQQKGGGQGSVMRGRRRVYIGFLGAIIVMV